MLSRHPAVRSLPRADLTLAVAAVLVATLPGATPLGAEPEAGTWVLDEFSVTVFDYGEPSRNEVRDKALRAFAFGTDYVHSNGNTYSGHGTLTVNVPDRIEGGSSYSVDARVRGDLSVAGTVDPNGEYSFVEVRGLCWGGGDEAVERQEQRLMPGAASASLSAALAPMSFVAPDANDPRGTPSHNCDFVGSMLVGFAIGWQVRVQAQYEPLVGTEPTLTLEANPNRLPPSGASPSTSDLTATVEDAAGNPLTGERVTFRLDPADMGRLDPASATTNGAGEARARYTAPTQAQLGGRGTVGVRAAVPARNLERGVSLAIESTRLSMTIEPGELPLRDPPATARIRVVAERFDGRPLADDIVEFKIDPPGMGSLAGDTLIENRAVTDAQGVVELLYLAPPASALEGLDLVGIEATNISHGGEASGAVRFVGLHVVSTQPPAETRDVELEPRDAVRLTFDRALDPATVNARTVKLRTLWHGDLKAAASVAGSTIEVVVNEDPIPDVGLEVTVTIEGGETGVHGQDGSVLRTDEQLHFSTLPRLKPEVVVSQVVDNPRDLTYGAITISPKPFVARVKAGLATDSELKSERTWVELESTWGPNQTVEHVFYPGDWPPTVPDDAVRHGNSANFPVLGRIAAGGHTVSARMRPFFAPAEKAMRSGTVTVNVSRWNSARSALNGIGVMLVPLQNHRIPGYAWTVSRGQQLRWSKPLGPRAGRYLPLDNFWTQLGYFEDTSCHDPDRCKFDKAPWTEFQHWARHVGRAGFATPWSYVVAVVPPGWFDKLADHPDVLANPDYYHAMLESGIWSDWGFPPARPGEPAPNGSSSPIIEADASPVALAHALGDILSVPHTYGAQDVLAGYDLEADAAILSDGARWTGAKLAIMNEWSAKSPSWPSRTEYEFFLDRWFTRACQGPPPCQRQPLGLPAEAQSAAPRSLAAQADEDLPLVGVSGVIRAAAMESATIEPLIAFDGRPTLTAGGTGAYEIVLADAGGAVLGRYAFTPALGRVDGGLFGSYLFAVPRPADMASVAILHAGAQIGVRRRSANAPAVAFTRPAPGGRFRGAVDVAWAGTDADGDALTYHLMLSADGGTTWLPLLTDSPSTSHAFDARDVPNGPDVRLRVVASDGFRSTPAEVSIELDSPQEVVVTLPEDGARGVSPLTRVMIALRDPLDPTTVTGSTFGLRDAAGAWLPGDVTYSAASGEVTFVPSAPLAALGAYEARLTSGARAPDGRTLGADTVWHFTVRGRTVYLPRVAQSGNSRPLTATPVPTFAGSPPGPQPTRTAAAQATPTRPPTGVPSATPTRPAPTLGPSSTSRPTATPTPTAVLGGVRAVGVTTTSTDQSFFRMAFAPGEELRMWVQVSNPTGAPVSATFEFVVVGDGGFAPPELAWTGPLDVPAGTTWFSLDRTLGAQIPEGPYRFLVSVRVAGESTTVSSDVFVAARLVRADSFTGSAAGWTEADNASVRTGWLDDSFQMLIRVADFWRYDTPSITAATFAVEADVAFAGTAAGGAGLVTASASGDTFFVYIVTRDGRFALFRRANAAWEAVVPAAASPLLGPTRNHLLFAGQADELRMYANGRILATAPDVTLPTGLIATYADAAEAGLDARFDNVRIYSLSDR